MNRHLLYLLLQALLLLILVPHHGIAGDATLSVEAYLSQVKQTNESVKGALEASRAAAQKKQEKYVSTSPTLFANAQLVSDSKRPQMPFFTYDQINSQNYTFGLSQATSFGLSGKLYYALDYTNFQNASLPGQGNVPLSFYDARPVIELSQSIWGNGFGRTIRAGQDMIEGQSGSAEFGNRFQVRSYFLQAESAYWRLAFARACVEVQREALGQAAKLFDYTTRRSSNHLGEEADALQAKAAFELGKLQLRAALDEEKSGTRAFNALRNVRASEVTEVLQSPEKIDVTVLTVPKRGTLRDDVNAAKEQVKAMSASSVITVERNKPTLDIFGSFALNGRDNDVSGVFGNSYSSGRPTKMVGAKLSIPLDLDATSSTREGAIRELAAAEMTFQQKLKDQEQNWDDLTQRLEEAKARFALSETIEKAQDAKLKNERKRLNLGRTTTYQVLLFEQDFSQSQLIRLRAQFEVLSTLTQMKLFSKEEL